jgi:hypothetical protein
MAVPNIFGTATAAIPLSQLDQNFATAITLGNTAVYLGNTTTSLGNVTLTNVTISSGTSNIAANVSTAVGLLPEAQGGTGTTTGYYGFKNRIINGAMVIDQRNAGAASTIPVAVGAGYTLDRWRYAAPALAKFTLQQNQGGVTTPAGFRNYLGLTSSAATAVAAGDAYIMQQYIEGFNTADLGWGTASAASVTLSFIVYSSLTGTFGGSLQNSAQNRSYPFTYSIPTANTWTTISITIAGDTSGTWIGATSGLGISLTFGLGVGSTFSGTAGAWAGANYFSATGAVSVVGTSGATFYITGVQLEKGSTATSFDYRPYGTELALCQRYYYRLTQPTASSYFPATGLCTASTLARVAATFPVTMRAVPTALDTTGTASDYATTSTSNINLSAVPSLNDTTANGGIIGITVSSGLTQGNAVIFYANVAGAYVGWSAEL